MSGLDRETHGHLHFRRAQAADVPAIVKLVNSAYRGEESRKGWTTEEHLLGGQRTDHDAIAELVQAGSLLLALRTDETIVGSVQAVREDDATYLGMLSVSPELQTRGIGRALIEEVERVARDEMKSKSVRMTVISVRDELIAYYERRGYVRTGETREFPMDDIRFGSPKRRDFHLVVLEKPCR